MVKKYQFLLLAATVTFCNSPVFAMDDLHKDIREQVENRFTTIQQQENNDPKRVEEKARQHLNAIDEKINRKNKKSKELETSLLCEANQLLKEQSGLFKIQEKNEKLTLKMNSEQTKYSILRDKETFLLASLLLLQSNFRAYADVMEKMNPMREENAIRNDAADILKVMDEIMGHLESNGRKLHEKRQKIFQLLDQRDDNLAPLDVSLVEDKISILKKNINDLTSKYTQLLNKLKNLKVSYEMFENMLNKYSAEKAQQNK